MWSPVYDVSSILTSIQSLLTDPNVNSPANNTAAVMYSQNYQEYCSRVRAVVEKSQEDEGGEEADDLEDDEEQQEDEDDQGAEGSVAISSVVINAADQEESK